MTESMTTLRSNLRISIMHLSVEYENKALHFAGIGMYDAAQVFATLALAVATRSQNVRNP